VRRRQRRLDCAHKVFRARDDRFRIFSLSLRNPARAQIDGPYCRVRHQRSSRCRKTQIRKFWSRPLRQGQDASGLAFQTFGDPRHTVVQIICDWATADSVRTLVSRCLRVFASAVPHLAFCTERPHRACDSVPRISAWISPRDAGPFRPDSRARSVVLREGFSSRAHGLTFLMCRLIRSLLRRVSSHQDGLLRAQCGNAYVMRFSAITHQASLFALCGGQGIARYGQAGRAWLLYWSGSFVRSPWS